MNIKTKKELAIISTIIFLTLAFASPADSSIISINNKEILTRDNPELSILSIDASFPYDYGYKVGKLLRLQYRLIDRLAMFSKQRITTSQDIKEQIEYIKEFYPSYLEELQGLSDSTSISVERLLVLKSLLGSIGSCTVTLSTGPATKNNQTFLTQNIDNTIDRLSEFLVVFGARLFSRKLWIKYQYSDYPYNYRYVFWGIPIIFETPIINEKGLSCGRTGTRATDNKSRYIDTGPGIGWEVLSAITMQTCKNVSEVVNLWTRMERQGAYSGTAINDVYSWCDSEGGILVIEETHNHIIKVFGNSTDITGAPAGILWHTNHHQWLDPYKTGSVFPEEYPGSKLRAERARELLELNYGNITLDICKSIVRDHGGGSNPNRKDSYDICSHADKNSIHITELSYIINPQEMLIYFAHGMPCRSIFWRYDISKKFAK